MNYSKTLKKHLTNQNLFFGIYEITFVHTICGQTLTHWLTEDKYGIVGELSFKGENLQKLLVKEGHA